LIHRDGIASQAEVLGADDQILEVASEAGVRSFGGEFGLPMGSAQVAKSDGEAGGSAEGIDVGWLGDARFATFLVVTGAGVGMLGEKGGAVAVVAGDLGVEQVGEGAGGEAIAAGGELGDSEIEGCDATQRRARGQVVEEALDFRAGLVWLEVDSHPGLGEPESKLELAVGAGCRRLEFAPPCGHLLWVEALLGHADAIEQGHPGSLWGGWLGGELRLGGLRALDEGSGVGLRFRGAGRRSLVWGGRRERGQQEVGQ